MAVAFGAAAVMLAVFLLVSKNLRSALERGGEGEGNPLGHGGPGLPGAVAAGGKVFGGTAKGHAAGSDPESHAALEAALADGTALPAGVPT